MEEYHIVNGDSTAELLKASGLAGEIIVWREMLCEGPRVADVLSPAFLDARRSYFRSLGLDESFDYDKLAVPQWNKLKSLPPGADITLWFEFDLFCQVNLLALGYWLCEYGPNASYHLVCTGPQDGEISKAFLSDYAPGEVRILFERRTEITDTELVFLRDGWLLYVNGDPGGLASFPSDITFPYLPVAMTQEAALHRRNEEGLDLIQQAMTELISRGAQSQHQLVAALLAWQAKHTVLGFGDLQYQLRINDWKDEIIARFPRFNWDEG